MANINLFEYFHYFKLNRHGYTATVVTVAKHKTPRGPRIICFAIAANDLIRTM